jgi:outer membrane protein OmpA-like peptidoglycan-associated protein
VSSATKAQRPAGIGETQVEGTGVVQGVDAARSTITFSGPGGSSYTFPVKDPKFLAGARVGDPVAYTYAEAAAVDVAVTPRPVEKPVETERAKIAVGRIDILEKVYFDTGRSSIQEVSYPLLNDVATVIKGHPEVAKVLVEGHTDSTGKADFNRKLSQSRSKGYGPDRPVDTNKTRAGREKNRRVEFIIPTP